MTRGAPVGVPLSVFGLSVRLLGEDDPVDHVDDSIGGFDVGGDDDGVVDAGVSVAVQRDCRVSTVGCGE